MENWEKKPISREENLYYEENVESAISDDKISPEEEGFMQGYNEAFTEEN